MVAFGIKNLEFHAAHACNLSCESCSHFSNHNIKGVVSPEEAERQFRLWSDRLVPTRVVIMGGEPAVNRNLVQIIKLAAEIWTGSRVWLITNGFLLHRHPELPGALQKHDVRMEISVHHKSPAYRGKVREVESLVSREYRQVDVRWRKSFRRWSRVHRTNREGQPAPYVSNPRKAWSNCRSRECTQLFEGKLWKCPQVAYFGQMDAKLGLEGIKGWDPFRGYRPLDPAATDEEIKEFLKQEQVAACGCCPEKYTYFNLPSPLKVDGNG